MKESLAKIREAKAEQKCQITAEVFLQLESAVGNLSDQQDSSGINSNIEVYDYALDEMEAVLEALETLLTGLDPSEVKRLKANLEKDYDECLELGRFYEWLNPDGKSYTADYAEFVGRRFEVPTKEEILAALTPQKLKLYKQMEKDGLEPKLQITPLAFNIRTLVEKIDAKKAELKITRLNTFVWERIKDEELLYEPTGIKASDNGRFIDINGGISKSQFIKAHRGFLVDIVPMKQDLDADESIQKDIKGEVNNDNIRAQKYFEKQTSAGQKSMCYESYLSAQMRALKNNKPLETMTFTLLLGSSLDEISYLSNGDWLDGIGALSRPVPGREYTTLRVRGSVGIL